MSDETEILVAADDPYELLLADLRDIIARGRGRAATAVQTEIVETYWRVGERVVREEQGGERRATYGTQLLVRLGRRLNVEFGRAFDERNLRFMRQFYLVYPNRNALRTTLSWTIYRRLMRLPNEQRAFYEQIAVGGRWSSRELDKQINAMLYERTALSRQPDRLLAALPIGQSVDDQRDVFKDPYILDFLGLEDTFSEKDLEIALVRNIEQFLLELGTDFCFVGRQHRITIGDEDYYIDLVFYHRGLRCLVLVDLKIGTFAPGDAAQMKLYLNWVRKHDVRAGEAEPLGLILCGARDEQIIELLLADPATTIDDRIRVAQYLLLNQEQPLKERLARLSIAYDEAHGTTDLEEQATNGDGR
jgi:predicted nuclease of restriction endonuclease-like (RecB) superfamily